MNNQPLITFSASDIQETQPAMKIGLLATVTPEGLPHVTLLSSLMACDSKKLCFGQFTEGMSKKHIVDNPKAGFLIMSMNKELWNGKASYTHLSKDGPEYEYYNNVPMFRYNAYFGVHTVYYLELVSQSGKSSLPMNQVIFAAVQTMLARALGRKGEKQNVLNSWTHAFLNKLDTLKFLSYIGIDGYPVIIPAIQTQSLDSRHAIFSTSVYKDELENIPTGADLCIFSMALTMEDVLLRGKYLGIRRMAGIRAGVVEIDWVYNPMPPVPGQVYPPVGLKTITEF
jgi:Pyridoxamine 5'-phosphate oxidase